MTCYKMTHACDNKVDSTIKIEFTRIRTKKREFVRKCARVRKCYFCVYTQKSIQPKLIWFNINSKSD